MMHQARSDNHRTGTVVFQTHDTSLEYIERLVDADIEFVEPPASGFDPGKVLQEILGRTA